MLRVNSKTHTLLSCRDNAASSVSSPTIIFSGTDDIEMFLFCFGNVSACPKK